MGAIRSRPSHCSPLAITTAATPPTVPATMKLAPLHRKSSCQILQKRCCVEPAIAYATRPVLTKKYAAIAATSGLGSDSKLWGAHVPPSRTYTHPVVHIVITSAATLNAVRYAG